MPLKGPSNADMLDLTKPLSDGDFDKVVDSLNLQSFSQKREIERFRGRAADEVWRATGLQPQDVFAPLGYKGVIGGYNPATGKAINAAVFDPKNIRSRFAAFDPKNKNSANLLGNATPEMLGVVAAGSAAGVGYAAHDKKSKNALRKP
jgi:hypothetical protein